MIWMLYATFILLTGIFIYVIVLFARHYMSKLVDRRIFTFQNDLITKHCAEVEHIYAKMRGWRHDYHNHIQALQAHLSLEQYGEIKEYLSKLNDDLNRVDTVLKTGNTMVDAILNSKISLARENDVTVNAKAVVPKELTVSEIDLCVILGNLIDNAVEACQKCGKEAPRVIRLYIDLFKEQLYISVSNTSGGEIVKDVKGYYTTKGANHGFGLMRIDSIVQKYGGWVNRKHEEGVFATEIMLPL